MVDANRSPETIFSAFFEQWMIRQEHYLQQLLLAMENDEDDLQQQQQQQQRNDLISEIVGHYAQYLEAKAKIVEEDVFLVVNPTWLTLFERSYLWLGGLFRPGLAFHIVTTYVSDLGDDQSQRVARLMSQIKEEEDQVMFVYNRLLEEMVSPTMLEIAGQVGRVRNGEENKMESAVDSLKESMQGLVEWADFLRKKTVVMLLEILKPAQALRFLAAVAHLHLMLRRWGLTHTNT